MELSHLPAAISISHLPASFPLQFFRHAKETWSGQVSLNIKLKKVPRRTPTLNAYCFFSVFVTGYEFFSCYLHIFLKKGMQHTRCVCGIPFHWEKNNQMCIIWICISFFLYKSFPGFQSYPGLPVVFRKYSDPARPYLPLCLRRWFLWRFLQRKRMRLQR